MRAFLANEDLLDGRYEEARRTFLDVEKSLPKGAAPFAVRYGLAFSDLYEGRVDEAIADPREVPGRVQGQRGRAGLPRGLHLELDRADQPRERPARRGDEGLRKGYESVPGSSLPDDQKQLWLGRLHHGRCRVLARMGRHEEAWTEALKIKKMIDDAGEAGKQYLPAWHYLAGYLELEKGDCAGGDRGPEAGRTPTTPSTSCSSPARTRRRARPTTREAPSRRVVDSRQNGLERALAYPEAKRKLAL